MKLLVTGGAGFIGSNFVRHMLNTHAGVEILTFDVLTYAGSLENLRDEQQNPRHTFVQGDITDPEAVEDLFARHAFDAVVNFAAESHVDRSIHFGGCDFVAANTLGVQVLLEAARRHQVPRFLQISTDEVYGSLGHEGEFTESTPLHPNNPYAAAKAGGDHLALAAHRTHGQDVVITRSSNNFGPYQFPEKLIPLMVFNALEDKPLPVYGDGMHIRDWLYVEDNCRGIDLVLRKGRPGEVYNIGGGHEVPNLSVVRTLLTCVGKPESLIEFVADRPGHDRRYALDCSKLKNELGWAPQTDFGSQLEATVRWYLDNRDWREKMLSAAYNEYRDQLYGDRAAAE